MRRILCICFFAPLIVALAVSGPASAQGLKGREYLGLRLGGVASTGELDSNFGTGTEMELHFMEGITSWLGIGAALSSHNFGDSKNREKDIEFTGLNRPVDLHIYSITLVVLGMSRLGKRFSGTVEGGFGLYTINATITSGIFEGNRYDNQFGAYAGAGLLYGLSRSLYLNLNAKYHFVFSGSGDKHPIYFYTEEDTTGFLQIAFGVLIAAG